MIQFNSQWSRTHLETLMDVVSTLADHTASPELCAKIPDYLSRVLGLEPITLAVIESAGESATAHIKFIAAGGEAKTDAGAAETILELYRQTRPLSAGAGPTLRSTVALDRAEFVKTLAAGPKALVLNCAIDEQHRLLLVVHQQNERAIGAGENNDLLGLIAGHLAKLLKCLVTLQDRPESLGEPFTRLTDREWTVLRALNSDEGEKQLADRLQLSPHTLHSHIKSIYRKVGVQGRLPLLQQLNEALLQLRVTTINMRAAGLAHVEERVAVAVG